MQASQHVKLKIDSKLPWHICNFLPIPKFQIVPYLPSHINKCCNCICSFGVEIKPNTIYPKKKTKPKYITNFVK